MADRPVSTDAYIQIVQKATVYDLTQILRRNPEKAYTVAELEQIMFAYLKGLEQK